MHEHHVAGKPGRLGARERDPRGRPDQPLRLPVLDVDDRPVDLEVVEVLGVDGADRGRLPGDAQMVDDPAGRLARVVPAFEPGDGDGRGEFADVVELDEPPPPRYSADRR